MLPIAGSYSILHASKNAFESPPSNFMVGRSIAKTDALLQKYLIGNGGSDRDLTCDPFDVNEVLSR